MCIRDRHGDDLTLAGLLGGALCEIGVAEDHGLLLGTLEHIGHDAMDGQVGVTADGACLLYTSG